ncbi:hypothetical protein [Acinetobacter ihumii]|uniref:hypothetical protein n=1 Tax=Acinetobacter ihumii TaxID=2483802 RepID=UPI001031D9CA|nr:hypothetical protein [Acinetobacter ihumii]
MSHHLSFTQSKSSRDEALGYIQSSIDAALWTENAEIEQDLKKRIDQHYLFKLEILNDLKAQKLSIEQLKIIHINYLNSIVKIFTDALSMLIYQTCSLENNPNIQPEKRVLSKIYARYLLSLNLLDELGFDTGNLECSSPAKSHLAYYLHLLNQLGIDLLKTQHVQPQALDIANFIQKNYDNYVALLLILSITEKQVIVFSEALSINLAKFNPAFQQGYYTCHGLADGQANLANDDNHENDLWCLFVQAFKIENQQVIYNVLEDYLELWSKFWIKMRSLTLENIASEG